MKPCKHFTFGIKGAISAASVALVFPAMAIENPQAEEETKANQRVVGNPDIIQPEQVKLKKVPELGVGGSPVSNILAKHLNLTQGHGLTLYHIVPDSAAEKAGLKPHDIITEFNGAPIGCQNSLRDAVMNCEPGEEVSFKYIHQGEAHEVKAKLGERLVHSTSVGRANVRPKADLDQSSNLSRFPDMDSSFIEKHMQRHIEDMNQLFENNHGTELDLHGLLEKTDPSALGGRQGIHDVMRKMMDMKNVDQHQNLPPGNMPDGMNFQFNSSSSVIRKDDQGSVTMKTMNGFKELIVKDSQGEIVFEGPYKTDQEKEAVPDDIRQRLIKMNFDQDNDCSFRLHIEESIEDQPPIDR
ncbi:MAG: S1C family serine protease [Akkermansiaceae bacterium]